MKIPTMKHWLRLRTAPLSVICGGVWAIALLTPGTDASPYLGPTPVALATSGSGSGGMSVRGSWSPGSASTVAPRLASLVSTRPGWQPIGQAKSAEATNAEATSPRAMIAQATIRIRNAPDHGAATRRGDASRRPHLIGARVWLASATPAPFSQTGASVWAAGADKVNPPGFSNIPAPPTPPAGTTWSMPPVRPSHPQPTAGGPPAGYGSASNLDNVRNEVAGGMNRSLKVALHKWPKVTPTATGRSGTAIGPQNILATQGVNYVVPASGLTTNLLVTPFNHPVVITPNTHDFQPIVRGDQIYYTITQNHPVGIFITGQNRNDPSISLTLVPRRIPAQTYFVTIPGYRKRIEPVADDSSGGSAVVSGIRSEMAPARPRTPHPTNTSTYVSDLTQAMRAAALGHVPEGFRQAPLSIGVVHRGPLTITGQSILVGNGQSIAEFMVVNNSTNFVNLVENDFWHKGVEAVSFYPNVRLIPGDSTVAIVAFQDGLHTGFGSVWRH